MNNYLDIILAPVITEKTANMEAEGKYAFKVANKANKTEIKQAIEKKFGVKVEKVNITNSHEYKIIKVILCLFLILLYKK